MSYVVAVPTERDKEHWVPMTRWVEAIMGPPGELWCTNDEEDCVLYFFKHRRHAEHFDRVWARTPIIFSYQMWEQFCLGSLGRARLAKSWDRLGWKPTSVLLSKNKSRPDFIGGRRMFSKYGCWFFENYNDALVFWMSES